MHRIDHERASQGGSLYPCTITVNSPVVTDVMSTEQFYINAPVRFSFTGSTDKMYKIIALTETTVTVDSPLPATGSAQIYVAANRYTEGDPQRGIARTVVTDSWANAVQEEIANSIELATALDKSKPWQMRDVLKAVMLNELSGLNVLVTNTDRVTIYDGACLDSTRRTLMIKDSNIPVTKTMAAYQAQGQGGLPAPLTQDADTSYYLFMIKHAVTGAVDFGFDTASNASNLLTASGYHYYRCIDVVKLNSVTSFYRYDKIGDVRVVEDGLSLDQVVISSATPADYDLKVPGLTSTVVDAFLTVTDASNPWNLQMWLNRSTDTTMSVSGAAGETVQCPIRFSVRPGGKVRLAALSGSPTVDLRVISFTPQIP